MCRSFCFGACRPGPSKNNYWGKRQMIILEKTIPLINPYMYRGLFCSVQRTGNLSAETKIPQFGLSQITDYYNKGEGTCRVRNLFIILLPCQFCEFFMKTMRNSSCVSCCHKTTKKSLLFHHLSNISSFLWRYQTCATLKVEVKFDATITLVEHRKNSFGAILHKATQIQLSGHSVSPTIYLL